MLLVAPLFAQAETTTSATNSFRGCPAFARVLTLGSTGDDVLNLQTFLAEDASVYPEGLATGYFGPLTREAVKRWQAKQGIANSGDAGTTGWGLVGPRTRALIAAKCGGGNSSDTPTTPPQRFDCPVQSAPPREECDGLWRDTTYTSSSGCPLKNWICVPDTDTTTVCPALAWQAPLASVCPNGVWRPTYNDNRCQNGWECVSASATDQSTNTDSLRGECPQVPVVECNLQGYVRIPGGYNYNGCPLRDQCLSATSIQNGEYIYRKSDSPSTGSPTVPNSQRCQAVAAPLAYYRVLVPQPEWLSMGGAGGLAICGVWLPDSRKIAP